MRQSQPNPHATIPNWQLAGRFLCHEVASAAGALAGATELLMLSASKDEEVEILAKQAARALNARIDLMRCFFNNNAVQPVPVDALAALAEAQSITLDNRLPATLPHPHLAAGLGLLGIALQPKTLRLEENAAGLCARAEGLPNSEIARQWAARCSASQIPQSGENLLPFLLNHAAQEASTMLKAEADNDRLTLVIAPPEPSGQ